MPKNKEKVKAEDEVEVVVEPEKPVAEEFPEVAGNGKFQTVAFKNGYVVYNPAGQRVSDVLSLSQAGDIARNQNQAAHIK